MNFIVKPYVTSLHVPIIAVTGTNGKTTITRLLEKVYLNAGYNVGTCNTDGVRHNGEVITKGEHILQIMHGAPPLVYFSLGALYNKVENHDAAVKHLSYVVEEDLAKEKSYVHPSADLRNYVKVLRSIERNPSQSPQTSASIRALERARKNRGEKLLSESRTKLESFNPKLPAENKPIFANSKKDANGNGDDSLLKTINETKEAKEERANFERSRAQSVRRKPGFDHAENDYHNDDDLHANRKPITEVLHDIYDKNVQ